MVARMLVGRVLQSGSYTNPSGCHAVALLMDAMLPQLVASVLLEGCYGILR